MHNLVYKKLEIFSPIFMKKKLSLKFYILWRRGCNYLLTSQGELLQPELNSGDTLFQLTSTIPGVRRHNSAVSPGLVAAH